MQGFRFGRLLEVFTGLVAKLLFGGLRGGFGKGGGNAVEI